MDFLTDPTPHAEAIDFINSKTPVAAEVFKSMLPELRARAITVSGITSFDVLQRVREEIATVHAGANWDEAKKKLVEEIHPFLADPEDPENSSAAERRAETLLRTHGFQASQAASFRNIAAQKAIFPYVEYHSMDDDRVRATHEALDGLVFPFDSAFVHSHWCPWDFGCRCHWVPISADDAQDIRKGDAKLPPDQRTLIEGQSLDHIETSGHLVRGVNQITDVRTPVEKDGPTAYSFNPQDLHIPIDKLQGRYDTQTWNQFEQWSRKTPVHDGGMTVWDWMGGKKLPVADPVDPKVAGPGPIKSVTDLLGEFQTVLASTPDPIEKRNKFHELLSLPAQEQSVVHHTARTEKVKIDEGFAFVRSITSKAVLSGPDVKILKTRTRAIADRFGGFINGKFMPTWTVAHELGHIIEGRLAEILKKSAAFLESRTVGEVPVWLGQGYRHGEKALRDEWVKKGGKAYSGKVYKLSSGDYYATEILSMGIQRLYTDPAGFFENDPEYFTYVVNTLRGL